MLEPHLWCPPEAKREVHVRRPAKIIFVLAGPHCPGLKPETRLLGEVAATSAASARHRPRNLLPLRWRPATQSPSRFPKPAVGREAGRPDDCRARMASLLIARLVASKRARERSSTCTAAGGRSTSGPATRQGILAPASCLPNSAARPPVKRKPLIESSRRSTFQRMAQAKSSATKLSLHFGRIATYRPEMPRAMRPKTNPLRPESQPSTEEPAQLGHQQIR